MRAWPAARDAGWLQGEFADEASQRYWAYILELTYRDRHAWDYGFYFSAWHRGAVHIHPGVNLVRNIGFGPGATHTHDERDPLANLPIESLAWPLRHPTEVLRNAVMDGRYEQTEYGGNLTRLLTQARQRARLAGSNHAI
jgi:hypothetical protein